MIRLFLLLFVGNLYATGWDPWPSYPHSNYNWGSDCIDCFQDSFIATSPYNFPHPNRTSPLMMGRSNYNWWQMYGNYRFPMNWNYPGIWSYNQGCMQGGFYPGSGNMAAAKPNIYLDGKNGTPFEIKAKLKNKDNMWITSPSHEEGWKGTYVSKRSIQIKDANYPYLYIDFRGSSGQFQKEQGLCGERKQVIDYMVDTLYASGFARDEVEDFLEYWPFKLPPYDFYCVYPQSNEQIKTVIEYSIKSDIEHEYVGLYFWVKTLKNVDELKIYKPSSVYKVKNKSSGDKSKLLIREWGVSFDVVE